MQMTTKDMAVIMDWIAKGQVTAREFCERLLIMENTIKEHVLMTHRNRIIPIAVDTDEDENPNQCDHPPLEWMKIFLEELRMMRDYERELRDHFGLPEDGELIKHLDAWWDTALRASQAADGTNPEPGEDGMTFGDIVGYPLMKLSDALYDGGLEDADECKITVENLTALAKELVKLRVEIKMKRDN